MVSVSKVNVQAEPGKVGESWRMGEGIGLERGDSGALAGAPPAGPVRAGGLPGPGLVEVVVLGNGLGLDGIEVGGLIEVVGERFLGDRNSGRQRHCPGGPEP